MKEKEIRTENQSLEKYFRKRKKYVNDIITKTNNLYKIIILYNTTSII